MNGSVAQDLITLGISAAIGAALCVLYDVLKSIRLSFKLRFPLLFVLDLLFFIVSALVTFSLLLVRCRGYVRGFVIIGEAAGFIFIRMILRDLVATALSIAIRAIKTAVIFIYVHIVRPIKLSILTVLRRISRSLLNIIVKSAFLLKKLLQRIRLLVYNYNEKKHSTDLKRRNGRGRTESDTGSTQENAPSRIKQGKKRKQKKARKRRLV